MAWNIVDEGVTPPVQEPLRPEPVLPFPNTPTERSHLVEQGGDVTGGKGTATGGRPITDHSDAAAKRRERDRQYRQRKREQERASKGEGQPQSRTDEHRAGTANPGRSLDDELNGLRDQYTVRTEAPTNKPTLITGYVLLLVTDAVFPALIAFALGRWGGRDDVRASQLRLDEKDKAALQPIADEAARRLVTAVDPLLLYAVVSGAMYLSAIPPESAEHRAARADAAKAKAEAKRART